MAGHSKNERISQAWQQGVLLDTSLWIRYFRPQGDEKVKAQVKRTFGRAGLHLLGGEGGAFGGRKGRRGLRAAEQRFGSFGRNTHRQGSVAWGGPAWIYPAAQWDYCSSSGPVDRPARYFRKNLSFGTRMNTLRRSSAWCPSRQRPS